MPPAADILQGQDQQKSNSGSNENNKNNSSDGDNNTTTHNTHTNTNTHNTTTTTKKKEKLSVMLIEDDVPTLLEVQSMLLRAGATEVHTASSGKKALEFLDRDSGKDIDLIFADIMMPEVRIDELKRVLKKNEKLKEVPVIVMSTVAQFESNSDSGQREGGGSGNGSGNDLVNEYGGSLQQHQQHTTTTTTRSSKRLKTNNNNNNTPQGKTNSNEVEVLQKPLSFRRVENVVYSHKRLLRSHNSSSSEADQKEQDQRQDDGKEANPKKVGANSNEEEKAVGGETKEGSAGGSGGGSGNGSGGSGPTTVKLPINSESPEEELRKKLRDGGNIASGAAVAPTTVALDEKTKTKEPNNLAGMDEGGAVIAPPTTNDDANDVVNAKSNQQLKRGVENSSPPLDEDVLKVRRAAATAGNERRRSDEKRWRNNRTHTFENGDGSDEGSGAGGRNRSRSFSAEDDKTESDLKPPTVMRKKRSARSSSASAKKVSGGSGSDEPGLEGKVVGLATNNTGKTDKDKGHPGLAVQLMNEHDGPTALLQLALAGSTMDSNASLRKSQSRSAFHGIIEKTQQKMQTQFQKVTVANNAAGKGGKKTTQKKGKGTPTKAGKATAGDKDVKMMNNSNLSNVGVTLSAPGGQIETEEMRNARELMQQQHQNAFYLFQAQQQMAATQQHLMRQMSNSPGLPSTASGQFPNLSAHMGTMGAMSPIQPFGFPSPHGQHNPFMMYPMQSFPPQSEYMNNFFQGLASTVATQHPHHQMHQQMNTNVYMGAANGAGNNTATDAKNGGKRKKKDYNNVSTCADRRAQAIARFLKKRKERKFEKKVRYESRQKLAESRPRVRGQFVKLDKSLSKEQQQELIEKMKLEAKEGEKKTGAKTRTTANIAAGDVGKSKGRKQSSDEKGGSNDKSKSSSKDLNTTSGSDDDDDGSGGSLNPTSSDDKDSRGRSSNESKDGMDNNNNNNNQGGDNDANNNNNNNNNNNSSDKGSDGHNGSTERRETPSV